MNAKHVLRFIAKVRQQLDRIEKECHAELGITTSSERDRVLKLTLEEFFKELRSKGLVTKNIPLNYIADGSVDIEGFKQAGQLPISYFAERPFSEFHKLRHFGKSTGHFLRKVFRSYGIVWFD